MRASYRIYVSIILALMTVFFIGCSQENDSGLTGPVTPGTTGADKGIPSGYYDSVDASNATTLRATIHAVIDDHNRIPYTSSATDTWNVLEAADQDPNNSSLVLDVYMNESYTKHGGGNTDYNREHSWPKSYGFPNDGGSNYPYTDCHHLFISNDSRNSSRGNKPYGTAGGTGSEYTTVVNNGVGGGSGVYPGWSNWANTTYWETWADRRGDVARALMYLDVRYEGGTHGVSGYNEPDLILTDNLTLIENSNTGSNESVAYMGLLAVLLQWHAEDPVDVKEQLRNDAVYAQQGNRNPFIDNPQWIDCVFGGTCGGSTTLAAPASLAATAGNGFVSLDWADNSEPELDHYTVYRATSSGGTYASQGNVTASAYTDNAAVNGSTYWYVVSASDASSNESAMSAVVSATPQAGSGDPVAWLNEFHYDNASGDVGELVEIAGTAGLDLSGWTVLGYNGSGGAVYKTVTLSGTLPDQQNGFGTLSFAFTGMQNGAPDGLALVDGTGTVIEFLSYEGSFTATDGAASGLTSTSVGVSETSTTAVGYSLQLAGDGSSAADFTWQAPQTGTAGLPNTGQTFSGGAPVNQAPTADVNGPYSGQTGTAVVFSSTGSTDSDGTIVSYAWTFGDGATSSAANPSHTYSTANNFTVTLTVTDDDGATGMDSTTAAVIAPNQAPTAVANGPYSGDTDASIAFSSSGSSDSDGSIVSYAWTFGDGGTSTAANPSHTYTAANTYSVTLIVTDNDGATDSATTSATVTDLPPVGADIWINELHYDNDGTDAGEFVEIAGATGTDLTGWSVVAYNGNGGASYMTVNLSGTLPATQGGFGVLSFTMTGLQNGAPDGLALIDDTGVVVQFLSYEGSFTATNGPANGVTSTNIGVSEASTSPVGHSLQLGGTGYTYADFTWQAAAANTSAAVNSGQTLGDGTTSGGWTVITYDDFESGWGSFVDGGSDCRRSSKDAAYAHQGTYCGRIRDNTSTSVFSHSGSYDLSSYSDLEVDFWFQAQSMDNSNEDFWVQLWDGSTWQTVASFAQGTDFVNGQDYHEVVQIPTGSFTYAMDAKIRFRCDASGNSDWVYIDEVEFRGFN